MRYRNKELAGQGTILPMNLQFFADEGSGDGGSGGETGGDTGAGTGDPNNSSGTKPPSFDEFLSGEGNQAEFDRRVQAAITEAQKKWQLLTDDQVSEAEKLAKMTKDEKAQYLSQKKEKELADKEAALNRRELMAEAKNTLTEKKLPLELAEVLNYADAESCSKSITALEKAFQKAVEAAVNEKLKGGIPPKKAPDSDESDLEKQVETFMRGY